MSDTLLGVRGKDFVIVAADSHTAYSIMEMKNDEDKITQMDDTKVFACGGPCGDRNSFMEYCHKNIMLYKLRNGVKLSTKAAANWTRNELATALRKGPYQTDIIIGGWDEGKGASLYYMDYMASMQSVSKAGHGYGSYFSLSLMDKLWHPDITEKEGLDIIKKCIAEVHTRLILKVPNFSIKIVDKNGVRVIKQSDL